MRRIGRAFAPTLRYWMQTEVHVFAFSVSAGLLLSFFPFLIVMLSICRYVLKWKAGVSAVYFALGDYFPDQFGEFIRRNFEVTVASRGPVQAISIVLLFFTASGIFEPLEVALNRVWNCPGNRNYFKNQLISLGLTFACGALMLFSTTLTALNNQYLAGLNALHAAGPANFLGLLLFKAAAIPMSMLVLFLIYWLLPNCKIKPARMILPAIIVGLLLELLKYINLWTWPYLRTKLQAEYGPFYYTVTIILWGFLVALVVLAGAEWTARHSGNVPDRQSRNST
ncbi:MAG TPA: YihY/virulence factor BrkB family protein [Bryobacteraceae bacterium]|nr:YihY/virulence factor BrkB family protein [Bryobacteraceae bacterium]